MGWDGKGGFGRFKVRETKCFYPHYICLGYEKVSGGARSDFLERMAFRLRADGRVRFGGGFRVAFALWGLEARMVV